MREHPFAAGDLVKARPRLRAPRDPKHERPFIWPYYYPARVTDLVGDDGVVIEFLEYSGTGGHGQVITPWARTDGYSVRDLHEIDCTCARCEPDAALADPRSLIDRLTGDLEGIGPRRATRTDRLLAEAGYAGSLRVLAAAELTRGDFLLFPHQHVHAASEIRGDVHLRTCSGTVVLGSAGRYLVFRPRYPAPVCDRNSHHHDLAYASPAAPGQCSALEAAGMEALADLGLVESDRATAVDLLH